MIIEINLTGREKKSHLYTDPLSSQTNEWQQEDAALFDQLLSIMKLSIQDLMMHMSIMKEMWNYLEELYLGKNNLNRAFDII